MTTTADRRAESQKRGRWLQSLCVESGVKQVEVATAMGLTEAAMSSYLTGRRQWPEGFEEQFRAVVADKRAAK